MAQHKGASAGIGGATGRSFREPFALSDRQWEALAPLVPGADAASRGRIASPQRVVEGILFALRNGMGLQSVPPPYPSGSTLYRRYTAWTANGQWDPIWSAFLETLSPSERRQWEAAAKQRPGGAAETGVEAAPVAQAVDEPPPLSEAKPVSHAVDVPSAPLRTQAPGAPSEAPARAFEPRSEPETPPPSAQAIEPAARSTQVSSEAARQRIEERLGLSAAESEIVGRRIGDHGVPAALLALDEVERRIATGTMRGVGGMPMSAFEIWVCAVGLARRPIERPRAPRPERTDRQDGDRDRRKRQWRKAP